MIRHLLPLAALLFLAVYRASPVGANHTPCEDAPHPKRRKPESTHREIYRTLQIPEQMMTPVKTWTPTIVTENGSQ